MIKKLLIITLFAITGNCAFAQSLVSITPNQGMPNQTLTTTVTSSNFYFTMSSQPTQGNLYFNQGGWRIDPNWVNVTDDDHFDANWTIPQNAPYGYYDLVYEYYQFWTWPPTLVTAVLPGSFNVLDTCNIQALPTSGIVCQNDSVKLTYSAAGTYQWRLNGVNIPGANSKVYYAKTAGSYTLVTTGTTCTSPSAPFAVSFYPLPVSTISPSTTQTICQGQTLTFQANTAAGQTYQWKKNGSLINGANTSSLSVQDSGYYKCIITNANGCSKASSETRLKVSPLPSGILTLQPGAAGGIDAEVVSYNPTINYGTAKELNTLAWTINGNPVTQRTYLKFDLSTIPPGSIITSATLNLYFDSTTTSANHTLYGDNRAYIQRVTAPWNENTITWNNQPTATTINQILLPASTMPIQDYRNIDVSSLVKTMVDSPAVNYGFLIKLLTEVQYRSLLFCSSDFPVASRRPKLVVKYTGFNVGASNGTVICNGDSTELTAPTGAYTYQWKKNGNAISGATALKYTAKTAGTYSVKVTNSSGCTLLSTGKTITVNTLPNSTITPTGPTTFCNGDSVVLKGNYNNTHSYQWKKNNTSISGATNWKYTAKTGGSYTLKVTNTNGCSKISPAVAVSVPCREDENMPAANIFHADAYPNPSSGNIYIRITNPSTENLYIRIYDITGRVVYEMEIQNTDGDIPVKITNPGMYKAEIIQGKNIQVISLVKTE